MKREILFVEDDQVDQMAFKRSFMLEAARFNYTIAGSISEARELLAQKQFDILILDFVLGDGTALDLLKSVADIPSIVMTGQGSVEVAVDVFKAGAADYVIKEPNHSHLMPLINSVGRTIKRHQTEQDLKLFKQTLQMIDQAVFITNRSKKVVYVNKKFTEAYGASESEFLGRTRAEIEARWKKEGRPAARLKADAVRNNQGQETHEIVVVEGGQYDQSSPRKTDANSSRRG